MVITIKFVGAFRGISGTDRFTITSKDAVSLREAIKEVVRELPRLNRVLIDPELENSRPNSLILVNGKEVSVLHGLDTVVKNGDEVVFVPVIHGG